MGKITYVVVDQRYPNKIGNHLVTGESHYCYSNPILDRGAVGKRLVEIEVDATGERDDNNLPIFKARCAETNCRCYSDNSVCFNN